MVLELAVIYGLLLLIRFSCNRCPVANGIAAQTATFTIDVTSTDGCKAKDDVTVIVACNNANLNLPSAFTPDNNGNNDWFYPLTRGYRSINKFGKCNVL